jgi:selenocysteine-specific elongation factor
MTTRREDARVQRHFIVATAGHVDHGKSSIVKALTGTDPDRLPEEKARKITIDLGFAELKLRGPRGEEIHAAIVDVPGHEDFVRNMIAGVGSIDLALLVVAADDGWMPQTEEHLQILEYLGVTRAVIALTKIDIGDPVRAEAQIRERLRETYFSSSAIVRVSARTADGLDSLRDVLASELAQTEPPRDIGKPRLFVDRAFTLRGIGTVVTGTLTSGTLRVGDSVVVQPRGTHARIRSLQSHGRDVDLAVPGMRTAMNLPDLTVRDGIARGDVVTIAGLELAKLADVLLTRSPRSQRALLIKSRASVCFHHGTTRQRAKIILLDSESLPAGSKVLARIELSEAALIFVGDRFAIRDGSEQHTIAGGIVLDLHATDSDCRQPAQLSLLNARAAAPSDADVYAKTEIARRDAILASHLLMRSRFSAAELAAALQRLYQRGEIFRERDVAADAAAWRRLRNAAAELIDSAHRKHPDRVGLDVDELRSCFRSSSPEIVDALIVDLCNDEFVRVGCIIARRSHQPTLPSELELIADRIRQRLLDKPFDPPSSRQLAADAKAQQALRFLIEQGEAIQISDDLVLSRSAYDRIKTAIAEFIAENGPAIVSQMRQALGSSRRVMVPLLERLDREGFTRRIGDKRTLAQQISSAKLANASNARST